MPAFSQSGVFRAENGRGLLMHRPHWLSTEHEMCQSGAVRAGSGQSGLFHTNFEIDFEGCAYSLEPVGMLSEDWWLIDGEGNTLLCIEPQGFFGKEVLITLQPGVDIDLAVFAYYLFHLRQKENTVTTAAIGGALAV